MGKLGYSLSWKSHGLFLSLLYLQNLVFGTVFYSGTLALYFLLLIRFGKRETWIARYIEPIGHLIAIGYPITSGIVAIYIKGFNPLPMLPGWCWISEYPWGCSDNDELECTRGYENVTPPMYFLAAGPILMASIFAVIFLSMVLIFLKVRDTEKRLERYAGTSDQSYERTKEVGRQGLLYISAFLLTYFPIAGSMMTKPSHMGLCFLFNLLVKALSTMQGFFNAIIFLRNQYRALTAQGQSLYFLHRITVLANFRSTVEFHPAADQDSTAMIVHPSKNAKEDIDKFETNGGRNMTLQSLETHEETSRTDDDREASS